MKGRNPSFTDSELDLIHTEFHASLSCMDESNEVRPDFEKILSKVTSALRQRRATKPGENP